MQYGNRFTENQERMKKIQKLLDQVEYQMLGESAETKSLYEDLRYNLKTELRNLNEEQARIVKETKNV